MRIVFVSFHTSPLETPGTRDAGGMNVALLSLARALGQRGHQVFIATRRTDSSAPDAVPLAPNVQVRHLRAGPEHPLPLHELMSSVAEFAENLTQLFDELAPVDVVHSHYWLSGVATNRALDDSGAYSPVHVMSLHTLGAEKQALTGDTSDRMRERVNAEGTLLANERITPVTSSQSEADALQSFYGVEPKRITVLHPGVDTTLFAPAAGTAHTTQVRLVVVGRIQEYKGQDFALAVLAHVRDALQTAAPNVIPPGITCTLRFVGSATSNPADEVFVHTLKRRMHELGLEGEVEFASHTARTAVAQELGEATLTLIPSRSETFGLVALESASVGTPVIAQAVGGLRESVRHDVSGLLMTNRDPAAWAEAIVHLVADRERYNALRESARTFALTQTWEKMALNAESLYTRLMSAP